MTDWLAIHGSYVTPFAVATLALMVLANLIFCAVMLAQRPWQRRQRATFWFVAGKAAFWGRILTEGTTWHPPRPYPAETVAWLAVLMATSIYLDYALIGHYVFGGDGGEP